jgi:hypothetical protein
VAPNRLAGCLLLALTLAACGKKTSGAKQVAGTPDIAALKAKRDSVKLAAFRDSTARAKWTACTDSVTTVMKKTADGKKKLAVQQPAGMIRPEFLSACGKPPAAPAAVAATPAGAKPADTAKAVGARPADSAKAIAGKPADTSKTAAPKPAVASPATQAPGAALSEKQKEVLRADSVRKARELAKADSLKKRIELARADSMKKAVADSVRTDSLKRAKETEVLRESFSYSGGSRDPFVSLITSAKVGPEFGDLQLVGIYQDLRYASNSVAVIRDKNSLKRYKLRVGDQIGRLKVAQIRQLDVVFTVEDFGFERQETLSMRKREAETP